jgi:hypothetical protein
MPPIKEERTNELIDEPFRQRHVPVREFQIAKHHQQQGVTPRNQEYGNSSVM